MRRVKAGLLWIKSVKLPWDIVSMIVLAVNSYIVMLYRNRNHHEIVYVIIALILFYLIVMPLLVYRLKRSPDNKRIVRKVNKGFRVFYTGISLTVIVINMIDTSTVGAESLNEFIVEQQSKTPVLILSAVMGFSCFWTPRITAKVFAALKKQQFLTKWFNKHKVSEEDDNEE